MKSNLHPSDKKTPEETKYHPIQKDLFMPENWKDENEIQFRDMFETALVGLFRWDMQQRRLTNANREAAHIFGFDSTEEFVQWINYFPTKHTYFDSIPEREKLIDEETYSFSSRVTRNDDTKFWAQFAVRYTHDNRFIEGTIKDISDQIESMERLRHAKAEAEKAVASKSQFLANISHEIRTPLNGIIGFAEILMGYGGSHHKDYTRKILDESDHLMTLINQLLDISRLEANKITLENILTDLNQVITEAEDPLRHKMFQKGLKYTQTIGSDVPRWFFSDPMRLRQVLSNLLSNAVKFSDSGTIVLKIIRLEGPEPLLRFSISDKGIGIPADKQEAIFGNFEQADTGISRKYGGTGLGVPICRELISLMGGTLRVSSQEGQGSEFTFEIPVTLPEEPIGETVVDECINKSDPLKDAHILVVEDAPTNREIARYHLESTGCTVFLVEDGSKALEFLQENEPVDLIIMDMHMPVLDGLATTRQIRAMGVKTPIIGMTASAYAEDRFRCLDSGMNDFLTKPLRRARFLGKAADWLVQGPHYSHSPGTGEFGKAYSEKTPKALAVFRYNDFLQELDGDMELGHELYSGFLINTEKFLALASNALDDSDYSAFHRKVHAIKGGAMNLMADELAEAAIRMERIAARAIETGNADSDFNDVFGELHSKFNRFRKAWLSRSNEAN